MNLRPPSWTIWGSWLPSAGFAGNSKDTPRPRGNEDSMSKKRYTTVRPSWYRVLQEPQQYFQTYKTTLVTSLAENEADRIYHQDRGQGFDVNASLPEELRERTGLSGMRKEPIFQAGPFPLSLPRGEVPPFGHPGLALKILRRRGHQSPNTP